MITHCRLKHLRWMGKDKAHFSVRLDDGTAVPLPVAFSVAGTALGHYLAASPDPGPVQVLGRVQKDTYRGGGAVQFLIEDIAASDRRTGQFCLCRTFCCSRLDFGAFG